MGFVLALIGLIIVIVFKILARMSDDILLLFALAFLAILLGAAPWPATWKAPWSR